MLPWWITQIGLGGGRIEVGIENSLLRRKVEFCSCLYIRFCFLINIWNPTSLTLVLCPWAISEYFLQSSFIMYYLHLHPPKKEILVEQKSNIEPRGALVSPKESGTSRAKKPYQAKRSTFYLLRLYNEELFEEIHVYIHFMV